MDVDVRRDPCADRGKERDDLGRQVEADPVTIEEGLELSVSPRDAAFLRFLRGRDDDAADFADNGQPGVSTAIDTRSPRGLVRAENPKQVLKQRFSVRAPLAEPFPTRDLVGCRTAHLSNLERPRRDHARTFGQRFGIETRSPETESELKLR